MAQPKNQNLELYRRDYRLTFAKEGRARYISHLDLMRAMQRAFKRAHIPIWYTQGFNPHAYLMFPLALSLGTESRVEILDIALTEDIPHEQLVSRLNRVMPQGLYFVASADPVMKHTDIAAAEYEIEAQTSVPADTAAEQFAEFCSAERVEIKKRVKPKKGKKPGFKIIDIKPHITLLEAKNCDGRLFINLRLPAGVDLNLNTSTVTDAFCEKYAVEFTQVYTKRTKILCKNGESFT